MRNLSPKQKAYVFYYFFLLAAITAYSYVLQSHSYFIIVCFSALFFFINGRIYKQVINDLTQLFND